MKIAYILSWELCSNDGVTKKVFTQCKSWIAMGHQVEIFNISKDCSEVKNDLSVHTFRRKISKNFIKEFQFVHHVYKILFRHLEDYNPDMVYLRSETYNPILGVIMKNYPTVIEINTNEESELKLHAQKSIKGKIRLWYYLVMRKKYYSKARAFCCVTYEIANLPGIKQFNKPTIVIPNTVLVKEFGKRTINHQPLPQLVYISTPDQPWQGIDKIINLAKETKGKLEFHIIGLNENGHNKLENVKFYGFLDRKNYEEIICSSDIGICTIALHRKNMTEACPLKTREYIAYGLPIITGYNDTAFIGKENPDWMLKIPNRENNLKDNVNEVLNFCYKYKGYKISPSESKQHVDNWTYESQKIKFFQSIINKKL